MDGVESYSKCHLKYGLKLQLRCIEFIFDRFDGNAVNSLVYVAFVGDFRLTFTDIDPDDPSRIFSFGLIVNDEERYDITNCNPKVNAIELIDILDELNESGGEDISVLARRMRKFCRKRNCFKLRKNFQPQRQF